MKDPPAPVSLNCGSTDLRPQRLKCTISNEEFIKKFCNYCDEELSNFEFLSFGYSILGKI